MRQEEEPGEPWLNFDASRLASGFYAFSIVGAGLHAHGTFIVAR
jgi:hypothetical protein